MHLRRPALAALTLGLLLLGLQPACADETDLARLASGNFYDGLLGVGLLMPLASKCCGKSGSLRTLDALVTTYFATAGIKALQLEQRPGNGPSAGKSDSFPSGHTSTAFAVATVEAKLHPRQAPYWYGAATLVGVSRVKLKRHHIQDVVAGAALGYEIGQLEMKGPKGLLIRPLVDSAGDGYGLDLKWGL